MAKTVMLRRRLQDFRVTDATSQSISEPVFTINKSMKSVLDANAANSVDFRAQHF
jgi:hypothetical protein